MILTDSRSNSAPVIPVTEHLSNENHQPKNKVLVIDYNGKYLHFDVSQDIIHFFREGKLVKVFTIHGNEYIINSSLASLEEQFKKTDFCKVSRSVLINCRTVRGYTVTNKRDHYKIILKPNYASAIDVARDDDFYVTKDFLPEFRNTLNHFTH